MLVWTAALCLYTKSNKDVQQWIFSNMWLWYLCLVAFMCISCGMMCHYKKIRKVPLNYALLGMYTITYSYVIAAIIPLYRAEAAVYAAVATFLMFIGLTAYACLTKNDMTKMGGLLSTVCMMVFCFILFQFIIGYNKILHLVFVIVIILITSMWIIHDTQLIVGGKHHRYQLELDDYVIGAMIIYSDIMTIFLYILQLFGGN